MKLDRKKLEKIEKEMGRFDEIVYSFFNRDLETMVEFSNDIEEIETQAREFANVVYYSHANQIYYENEKEILEVLKENLFKNYGGVDIYYKNIEDIVFERVNYALEFKAVELIQIMVGSEVFLEEEDEE